MKKALPSTPPGVAAAVARALSPPIKIGTTIDQMYELREQKRALEGQIKTIEDQYRELEEALMARLEAEGADKASGHKATASISSSVVGNVTDWDKFYAYVKKTGYMHLFQQRLSDPAVRELFEQGKKIPGCEPFTKKRLNLRSAV